MNLVSINVISILVFLFTFVIYKLDLFNFSVQLMYKFTRIMKKKNIKETKMKEIKTYKTKNKK